MDGQKLIDYLPAVLMLISFMTIVLVVITKFGKTIFEKELKASNSLLYLTSFLFIVVLIVHLFREQSWTADMFKVLIGVLVGAASFTLSKSMELSGNNMTNSIVNQALRDIKQKIDHFSSTLSQFENATINQVEALKQTVITKTEYLSLETDDPEFLSYLKQIWETSENDRTWKWIEACIDYPKFHKQLKDKIKNLESEGWKVASMNFDNIYNGVHINLKLEKYFA